MKQVTKLLVLAALLVAGQAMHAQAPAATGADVPELMRLIEQRKTDAYLPILMDNRKLQGAQLANADLSGASFDNSNLSNADVRGTNLLGTSWVGVIGFNTLIIDKQTNFYGAKSLTSEQEAYARSKGAQYVRGQDIPRLKILLEQRKTAPNTPINMQEADLQNADLRGTNLRNANFKDARLNDADLTGADLANATLKNVNIYFTNFSKTNLTNVDLTNLSSRTTIPSEGFNFAGANLTNVNFEKQRLAYFNITNANLTDANLKDADLSYANLTGVNFTNCKGFDSTTINNQTNFQGAIGLTPEQKAYARSKGAQNVPN